jgi:Outer membrane protein beta-barrel domain
MKRFIKSIAAVSALSVLAIAPVLALGNPASAQTQPQKGLTGSYIGAGVSAGLTNGGRTGDAANLGGNIQGRLAVPHVPVSVRGAVLFNDQNSTVMPLLTYDVPVAKNTNAYVGAGYSFVQNEGVATPLGNKSAPVVTAGIERGLTPDIVVYGDAKYGIGAYKNSDGDAVSLQAGLGYRF